MLLKFILIHQNLTLWLDNLVRGKGLEPSRPFGHSHLKAARLPIPPTPHDAYSCYLGISLDFDAASSAFAGAGVTVCTAFSTCTLSITPCPCDGVAYI